MKPALFRATRDDDDDDGGESRRGIEYNGREEDIKIGRKRLFCRFCRESNFRFRSIRGRRGQKAEGNREIIFLINLAQNVFEPSPSSAMYQ